MLIIKRNFDQIILPAQLSSHKFTIFC